LFIWVDLAVGFAVLVTVIGAGLGVATAVGFTGRFLPLSLHRITPFGIRKRGESPSMKSSFYYIPNYFHVGGE
jgi:hypothetical protein